MPQIGEIKRGRTLGHAGSTNKYIWAACEDCGKERWVVLIVKQHNPKCLKCRSCASKSHIVKNYGESNPAWKGGKKRNSRGYILIRLHTDDFFYSMTNRSGYVYEHRLIIASTLGRQLHHWEIVHHKNGIKDDNRVENLQLVTDDRHKQITVLENRITFLEKKVEEQDKFIKLLQWQIKQKEGLYSE